MFDFFKNKEKLLEKKLHQLQVKGKAKTHNNAKIKAVAILTTETLGASHNLKELTKQFLGNLNVSVFSFRNFTKEVVEETGCFTNKDFNRKGEVTNQYFKTFLSSDFDILLNIYEEHNLYLELANAISKAKFKVGFSAVNSELIDLEIVSETENLTEFFTEVKKYLQILNKLPKQENLTANTIL